ncbi:MAG: hypothetical protein ACJ8F1_04730 [Polyangia bacterium]
MTTKSFVTWLGVAVGLGLQPACGGGGPQEQTTPVCSGLPSGTCVLTVEDGFVDAALVVTDGVSNGKVRYTPGRFCMSGKEDPGATNMNWGSLLILSLAPDAPVGIAAPFTAAARGITQVQFTVDPAPISGLRVELSSVQRADCLTLPDCFTTAPFVLTNDGSTPTVVEDAATVTASLTSFVQPNWGTPGLAFDKDLIVGLQFGPQQLPGVVADYDFCIRDLKFLNAAGQQVSP